jgi:hypothetical protein
MDKYVVTEAFSTIVPVGAVVYTTREDGYITWVYNDEVYDNVISVFERHTRPYTALDAMREIKYGNIHK